MRVGLSSEASQNRKPMVNGGKYQFTFFRASSRLDDDQIAILEASRRKRASDDTHDVPVLRRGNDGRDVEVSRAMNVAKFGTVDELARDGHGRDSRSPDR